MNGILAGLFLMNLAACLAIWFSPKAAESLAELLLARAKALRGSRKLYRAVFQQMTREAGK